MSNHTPGIWHWYKNRNGEYSIWPDGRPGAVKIADVNREGIDDPEANARLMASAPEMKIALVEGVELLRTFEMFMCALGCDTKELNRAIGIIEELLDRTDGREEM